MTLNTTTPSRGKPDVDHGAEVSRCSEPGAEPEKSAGNLHRNKVDGFAFELRREDDGWKAICTSSLSLPEASGPTPAQALSAMARLINRYLYQHRRRNLLAGSEDVAPLERHDEPKSVTSDEG